MFVHHYKPLSVDEQAFVLAKHWPHLHLDDPDDFATKEAVAAITRITNGNFRLTSRLVAQIERIMRINELNVVTKEVVEAGRQKPRHRNHVRRPNASRAPPPTAAPAARPQRRACP